MLLKKQLFVSRELTRTDSGLDQSKIRVRPRQFAAKILRRYF